MKSKVFNRKMPRRQVKNVELSKKDNIITIIFYLYLVLHYGNARCRLTLAYKTFRVSPGNLMKSKVFNP